LEIAKFHDYAKPSRTEALARRQVIEQARKDVHEVLPEYVLEIFGSERTGIALATSDIDLRLVRREDLADGSGKIVPPRWERKTLEKALKTLFTRKFFRNPKYLLPVLRHARYPLLSLQHGASGLDIQIVLANDTSVSREYMRQYMQEYPYLRQVYSIVKTLFEVRGLSDVFRGGFGSYSIFMMIVASLQQMPHKRKDAMGALQNFLRFWAQFDTTEKGISIDPPELFDKREKLVMPPKVQEMVMVSFVSLLRIVHTSSNTVLGG
jgi:non-canonical poly(A) RNA polymerase PAPD5/7